VILILEVTSSQSTKSGSGRHTFSHDGGTIGRDSNNSWVLPHSKVSSHHARISWRGGAFYIEDTKSTNGTRLNSSRNRLLPGQPQMLNEGDRILIDPYEIGVSIARDEFEAPRRREEPRSVPAPSPFDASNPFDLDDPFSPPPNAVSGLEVPEEKLGRQELDPLALLDLEAPRTAPQAPNVRDLDRGLPLDAHFKPPAVVSTQPPAPPPAPAPVPDAIMIPDDYDPLAPDEPSSIKIKTAPPPPPPASRERVESAPTRDPDWTVARAAPAPLPVDAFDVPPRSSPFAPVTPVPPAAPVARPAAALAAPVGSSAPVAPAPPAAPPAPSGSGFQSTPAANLAAVLEGAGLDPAGVTPELAHIFGEILRVVVSGVMDVLKSRRDVKDEFRMRMTRFRTVENNPLKFSANVEDALHNLLVKRNPAYLGPVEAFEDAFDDLRNHQLAMLAGMRVAFEAMLAEFDPDRLQEEFDRMNKGLVPAKLRYWDLFRERRQDLIRDPEATFRKLFGEEFARAYEDQLKQLKDNDQ